MVMQMPQRNEPCPCGSGKKYKKCCAMQQPKFEKQFTDLQIAANKELQERIRAKVIEEIKQNALSAQAKVDKDGKAAVFTEAEKMALLMMSGVAIHRIPHPQDPTKTILSSVNPCQFVITDDKKIGVYEMKPKVEGQKEGG